MKLYIAGLLAIASLAAATPATAGYWNYGCKGNLDDGTTIESTAPCF
jgi:hypothetical protein